MFPNIVNYYMQSEFDEDKEEIKFLYKFSQGEVFRSHGRVIAKVAGLPQNVLAIAKEKSKFMTREKKNIGAEKELMTKFNKTMKSL